MKINFEAEVVQVQVKKTASVDKLVRIVLETDETVALQLQEAIAKNSVKITADF